MRLALALALAIPLLSGGPASGSAPGPQVTGQSSPAAPLSSDGPIRHALHDPLLAWESADVTWLARPGGGAWRPAVGSALLRALDEGESCLAVVPAEGRLVLAARSGELLVVEGPATVRLLASGATLHVAARGPADPPLETEAVTQAGATDRAAGRGAASPVRPVVRALAAPEGWREGPWATVDAGRCPDFRPPWAPPLSLVRLEAEVPVPLDPTPPTADETELAGWRAASGAADPLPSRVARPSSTPPLVRWRVASFPPDGRVDLTLAITSGLRRGDSSEAEVERWSGLSGGVAPLTLGLAPGRSYRLALTSSSNPHRLPAGRLARGELRIETLSEDDAQALEASLAGLSAMTDRIGESAVAVLGARLLETWGLDAEARRRWWELHAARSGHPQGPALLLRAYAAPPEH
jgi:hypothetical protein